MNPALHFRALAILRHHWRRDFQQPSDLPHYIATVSRRLARFGIRNVPSDPVRFLAFCQELGLFAAPKYLNKSTNSKKGA